MPVLGLTLVFRRQLHVIAIDVPEHTVIAFHDFERVSFKGRIDRLLEIFTQLVIPDTIVQNFKLGPMQGGTIGDATGIFPNLCIDGVEPFPSLPGKLDGQEYA